LSEASVEVNVRFFGFLNEVPDSRVTLCLSGEVTLGDVVECLLDRYGDRLRGRLLRSGGHLPEDVKLVVDAEVIDRLDHRIKDGTTVYILSQFAGGSGDHCHRSV